MNTIFTSISDHPRLGPDHGHMTRIINALIE